MKPEVTKDGDVVTIRLSVRDAEGVQEDLYYAPTINFELDLALRKALYGDEA